MRIIKFARNDWDYIPIGKIQWIRSQLIISKSKIVSRANTDWFCWVMFEAGLKIETFDSIL